MKILVDEKAVCLGVIHAECADRCKYAQQQFSIIARITSEILALKSVIFACGSIDVFCPDLLTPSKIMTSGSFESYINCSSEDR